MGDVCTDGRFDLIERFKRDLVEATNIETSPEEMAVLDSILFRMWQMGWLDKLAASPWHRVEEELPEKFVNVILANKRGKHYDIDKGWWNGYSFDRCAKGIYRNVTHWMPLPEPPKEEE